MPTSGRETPSVIKFQKAPFGRPSELASVAFTARRKLTMRRTAEVYRRRSIVISEPMVTTVKSVANSTLPA